jgi:hypothetical protein
LAGPFIILGDSMSHYRSSGIFGYQIKRFSP